MSRAFPFPALMVQGCTSDAGKSTVVAALCRLLARDGIAVAPFKPQNMGLNSAVTIDGGEIGRAQALQACAAGIAPTTDLNPVLLKPGQQGVQVIIHGRAVAQMNASRYHDYKPQAQAAVLASYARLRNRYQVVVVEGAGSPAEVNLRERDIANMGFAEAVDCPVVLVVRIDKGGAFAHLLGTLACLSANERARVIGFVINRFHGDAAQLAGAIDWLRAQSGKPVLAVLPHLHGLTLDAEDMLDTSQQQGRFRIVVPAMPRISNHTDFDALRSHPAIDLRFVRPRQAIPAADLIVLPGSKHTRADLAALRQSGWDTAIRRHLRYGGKVIGICGGYQMLGQWIHDPDGVEGDAGSSEGLGLLALETVLTGDKRLCNTDGYALFDAGHPAVSGYEMHLGRSDGAARQRPVWQLASGPEGAISDDRQVLGSYLHGLFDHPAAQQALLAWAGLRTDPVDLAALREASLDRLADACLPLYRALQAL